MNSFEEITRLVVRRADVFKETRKLVAIEDLPEATPEFKAWFSELGFGAGMCAQLLAGFAEDWRREGETLNPDEFHFCLHVVVHAAVDMMRLCQ